MAKILGEHCHLSCPIESIKKKASTDKTNWELFTKDSKSVGSFDDVVFACHTPTTHSILEQESEVDSNLLDALKKIEYGDNVVYLHSDPKLMPKSKNAWASWNCMGRSSLISSAYTAKKSSSEAMEGGDSGFGNRFLGGQKEEEKKEPESVSDEDLTKNLEGKNGRMKAVYVTYYLNRLQNLDTDKDVFVSLNPHSPPDPRLIHKRMILSHPQFSRSTLEAREVIAESFQGKDGLWFCGAWTKYGFHEDGCRSGFKVATAISNNSLPWAEGSGELVLSTPDLSKTAKSSGIIRAVKNTLSYSLPVAICRRMIYSFLQKAIVRGHLQLQLNDGSIISFGDGSSVGNDTDPVTLRIFDDWFFVKVATEYDLGLARAYMSGFFVVTCPTSSSYFSEETNNIIGDPVGLKRLFLLFIHNRDDPTKTHLARKSATSHTYSNALVNASGLLVAKLGSFLNFLRFKLTMDNSERGGSLKNIHAHYDLSNDLFTSFLDKETYMYSSAIYDAVKAPSNQTGLVFRGSLEEAQWRKLDTLLDRAQVQPGHKFLDIGFGWGGLSLHAAKKYGCQVHGITLSVEQKALAEERVKLAGLGDLITFEVIDYRIFARRKENQGRFDRVISCEMIEAVGHNHLGEFYWAVEQVLSHDGILVMEAITTPEARYESYIRSTDLINTIIFPGSCCPSLHALIDASYKNSTLTLEHIDNIGQHYAATLEEWRRRFNRDEKFVRKLGFDDIFMRVWNYYLTYCEAGFESQTINCLILVFSRQGCNALTPLCETRSVTQLPALSDVEVENWLTEA
jgi:cyclopropane-fatty-acyl-phospholipid synthase